MQPFVYAEIARYGLERNLKTSSGGFATERRFKTASGAFIIGSAAYQDIASSRIANKFFSKDGLSSRELMPYPLDPLRQPAPWTKYDHVTVKDRLDEIEDESREDKDVFEAFLRTFGGVTGGELSWTETLRWFALGGHDLERVAEFAGVYKLGNGGMTSLARLILQDYRGDVLMGTTIQEVSQERDFVSLTATNGSRVKAKQVVCTVPL
jgi:lysyl oxidase-like protein 2/3/4